MDVDVTSLDNRRAVNRWERVSVGDMLERVTWSFPDKEAIVGWAGAFAHPEHERLTYRQADELVNKVANGLLARGLQKTDRVMLVCDNSVEAYVAKVGIAKAGLVCVPVNPSLAPDVVAHMIEKVTPRLAIVDAEHWPRLSQPFLEAGLAPDVTIPIGGDVVEGSVSFADFVRDQPATEPDVDIHGDDVWEILFTSGTTAAPKGAMVSHTSSYFCAYAYAMTLSRGVRMECDLKLASFLPLIFHASDQIFTFSVFLSGGTLVIGRGPVPENVAAAITKERITTLWGGSPVMVGSVAKVLREHRDSYDAGSLKVVLWGWAALSPETMATFKELCGEDFLTVGVFGQTESMSCYRWWPDRWPHARENPELNYVGVPNPVLASTVMDEDMNDLRDQPGEPGEAVYRSPGVTPGYYHDREATEEAFRGGWFHSGDTCVYDEHGVRIMVDRFKDIVKSGGENVSSLRVETVLHEHPEIVRAAVVGLPHDRWGEAVTAIVIPAPGTSPDPQEIVAFSRRTLAGYEAPKDVIFVEEMPETYKGGKVLKYKLRQRFADHYAEAPASGSRA